MGKDKKGKRSTTDTGKCRNVALAEQILEDRSVREKSRNKAKNYADDDAFVDDKTTRKILKAARKQQEDIEEKPQEEHGMGSSGCLPPAQKKSISLGGATASDSDSDSDDDLSDTEHNMEEVEVDENDERAMAKFMANNPAVRGNVREKIDEKQTEIDTGMTDNASVRLDDMDPRILNLLQEVKPLLVRYRSGKMPKAFNSIPNMKNWEQVLSIIEPENWSAAAVYQATRIFSSNLNAIKAQVFYTRVLLPRVRDDIEEYKRLNYHLYESLVKSLFKPGAFFKGIVLPLCDSGTCTLREAIIVSSVITKRHIPNLYSGVAIMQISQMDYSGANSIFLRALLDKKYALAIVVVDAVVFHFLGIRNDSRELPVLWHQALLTFVQHYKNNISSDQKKALLELIHVKEHPTITPDIRRELVHSECCDEEMATPPMEASEQTS